MPENEVIDSAILLSTDHTNAQYNDDLEIVESKWKTKLKQLTDNADKCTEIVGVVSQLQQLNLKGIATQGSRFSDITTIH